MSVFIASRLDGYIATRDGSLAWFDEAASRDEDDGYESFLATVDALAMGRGTYDHIAYLDPLPFAGQPVFVFTHRPPPPRAGVTFWQESPGGALERWNGMGLNRVYVDGGALISQFLGQGLIDDLVLTKVPILLGDGIPLFHPLPASTRLRLEGVQSWPGGFVNLTYSRPQSWGPRNSSGHKNPGHSAPVAGRPRYGAAGSAAFLGMVRAASAADLGAVLVSPIMFPDSVLRGFVGAGCRRISWVCRRGQAVGGRV